jgi:predicted GH43/DUF377 family glycosyl hydrolase
MKKRGLSFPAVIIIVLFLIMIIIASFFLIPIIKEQFEKRDNSGLKSINDSQAQTGTGTTSSGGSDTNTNQDSTKQDESNEKAEELIELQEQISNCTEADWTFNITPIDCPLSEEQIKNWTKIGTCENGVYHNVSEIISCDYNVPTCTSFTYSDWGECSPSGTQARSVLSSLPSGCQGGNPIISQSCNYIPPTCIDETSLNSCSQTKSFYCNSNGELILDCSQCGCDSGYVCENGECVLKLQQILTGTLDTEIYYGKPNIYAPEVMFEDGTYKMWYGGGGTDIRDRIHYAESEDGINWIKKGVAVEAPTPHYNANDPTIVKLNDKYYMYMTVSEIDLLDRIYLSTSIDGLNWDTPIKVLEKGPYDWNSRFVSRPTVIHDDNMFKMWYDTTNGTDYFDPITQDNIGYATSVDGITWEKHPTPVFNGYRAIDVKKIQGTYVMLIQGAWEGTLIATSTNGLTWTQQGTLISPEQGNPSEILGHLTPFLFIDSSTNNPKTIYLGAGIPLGSSGYANNAIYSYSLVGGELEGFIGELPSLGIWGWFKNLFK